MNRTTASSPDRGTTGQGGDDDDGQGSKLRYTPRAKVYEASTSRGQVVDRDGTELLRVSDRAVSAMAADPVKRANAPPTPSCGARLNTGPRKLEQLQAPCCYGSCYNTSNASGSIPLASAARSKLCGIIRTLGFASVFPSRCWSHHPLGLIYSVVLELWEPRELTESTTVLHACVHTVRMYGAYVCTGMS